VRARQHCLANTVEYDCARWLSFDLPPRVATRHVPKLFRVILLLLLFSPPDLPAASAVCSAAAVLSFNGLTF